MWGWIAVPQRSPVGKMKKRLETRDSRQRVDVSSRPMVAAELHFAHISPDSHPSRRRSNKAPAKYHLELCICSGISIEEERGTEREL
jgi:hypothetical protein